MTAARLPPVRGHLDQVDLFRVLTFASVLAVHSFAFTNPPDSHVANGVAVVLHFTREAFFFLTGFVLVHSQRDRPLQVTSFWRKRLRLIGVPYLVWSVLYWAYGLLLEPRPAGLATSDLVWGVLGGHAAFHLYFLLVSIQIYLAFPLLLALVRACRRHPLVLAAALLAYEVAVMVWLHDVAPTTGVSGWLAGKAYVLLPTYLFWVVLGELAAQHLESAQTWLVTHARLAVAGGVLAIAASVGWYAWQLGHGRTSLDTDASAVLQPVMVLDSLGVIVLLAVLSCRWAVARPDRPRAARVLAWCSSASFGVYLVHALVLDRVLALGLHGPEPELVPQPYASVLAWVLTAVGSVALVAVLRQTPVSLPLTGRSRPRRTHDHAAPAQPPVPAGTRGA